MIDHALAAGEVYLVVAIVTGQLLHADVITGGDQLAGVAARWGIAERDRPANGHMLRHLQVCGMAAAQGHIHLVPEGVVIDARSEVEEMLEVG